MLTIAIVLTALFLSAAWLLIRRTVKNPYNVPSSGIIVVLILILIGVCTLWAWLLYFQVV